MRQSRYSWFITMFILIPPFLLLASGIAAAKTRYIADDLHTGIRTGPSTKNKIVAFVRSNSEVEVLETSGKWTYIRIADRREGWLLSRLLVNGPVKEEIIERLQAENEQLKREFSLLQKEDTRLRKESLEQQSKTEEREEVLSDLRQKAEESMYNKPTRWLILGASVLATGVLIGYYSKKKKKGGMFTQGLS